MQILFSQEKAIVGLASHGSDHGRRYVPLSQELRGKKKSPQTTMGSVLSCF